MRPEADAGLGYIAQRLLTHVAPAVGNDFEVSDVTMIAGLLAAIAQEYDRAAEIRCQDIEEMRGLFIDAAEALGHSELGQRLRKLTARQPESLRIGAINAVHDAFSNALIELHARIEEESADVWAKPLQRRIWQYYRNTARRHAFE
ncbi:MAG: hypothetical protein D6773_18470 [Alphaproteobacteria bacterium]|nr:MAG: hypothetical protein D6773_18470 [Alphaproteobacteria bacterium]